MSTEYHLVLTKEMDLLLDALDEGLPPLKASVNIKLRILNVNHNASTFAHKTYHANILEALEEGSSVFQVNALDKDVGENEQVVCRIENRAETHSNWFDIEPV